MVRGMAGEVVACVDVFEYMWVFGKFVSRHKESMVILYGDAARI